tara:strand:+ start:39556 stop:39972 length:417 start_codon:yes stop_codon:yes gene_type:complete
MTRAQLCVAEARSWLGTKWRHRGRTRFGIDCIGLIVHAVAAGGIQMRDRRDYGREPWKDGLQRELQEHFGDPVVDMQPGDVLLMKWHNQDGPAHVGIVGDYCHGGLSLIHSYSLTAVCEHRMNDEWLARIVGVYRPWQ